MYWPEKMSATIRGLDVRTSFMQRLPLVTRNHQPFLLLYPLAFESFDLTGFDVVISNSSAFCKGVVTPPGTLHICYCLTPMRWVWNYHAYVERERLGHAARMVLPAAISQLRSWDVATAQNVDRFLAISRTVAARIRKYYRRDAHGHLSAGQLRRVPAAAGARRRLLPDRLAADPVQAHRPGGRRVHTTGHPRSRSSAAAGATWRRCESRAGRNVEFVGRVSDAELKQLYAGCRGAGVPGRRGLRHRAARGQRQRAAGDRLRRRRGARHGRRRAHGRAVRAAGGRLPDRRRAARRGDRLGRRRAARSTRASSTAQVFREQLRQFVGESIAAHAAGARFA